MMKVESSAGRGRAEALAAAARSSLTENGALRGVVLVEGESDRRAVEALAARYGRDLAAEHVAVVPIGGARAIRSFYEAFGPRGLGVAVAGLCDEAEAGEFRSGLSKAGAGRLSSDEDLQSAGFKICRADLEDELIRALGPAAVEGVIESNGELRSLRTLQQQPVQRGWTVERQLRRFMGSKGGRKIQYAALLVEALDLVDVPCPLRMVLERV